MSRFAEKSPPPITFPALAVASPFAFLSKKHSLYELATISAHDLLAE